MRNYLVPSLFRWPEFWDEDLTRNVNDAGLDVYETEDEVVVRASVAGVKPDQIEITFEKGVLTITAQEEDESKDEKRKYYRKSSRSYAYRVAVPGNIDLKTEPEAEVENGILIVKFKKAEEAKPKKITIKSKKK